MSSVFQSFKNAFAPVHKAGYPFIAVALLITGLAAWLFWPLFWPFLVLALWVAYFFRDPTRVIPLDGRFILSPADGKISAIGQAVPPPEMELGDQALDRISIFMNVFNCHVNRLPMSGQIYRIAYTPGKFLNAELDKASKDNERNCLVLKTRYGAVGVVQIAGLVARRIVCWAREGQEGQAGARFGLIRFGSRLDVYMPPGARINVALGQTAIAGESVLAIFEGKDQQSLKTRIE